MQAVRSSDCNRTNHWHDLSLAPAESAFRPIPELSLVCTESIGGRSSYLIYAIGRLADSDQILHWRRSKACCRGTPESVQKRCYRRGYMVAEPTVMKNNFNVEVLQAFDGAMV